MTREELYSRAPQILRRIFMFGLPVSALFFLLWYKAGGITIWGQWVTLWLKPLSFIMPIHFETDQFVGSVTLVTGKISELVYSANQFNLSLATVITLFVILPHTQPRKSFFLALWLLLIVTLWHMFMVLLQLHHTAIGPEFANRHKLFWESSSYYRAIHWVANLEKLILRYWSGFWLFLAALAANNLCLRRRT
jgi:hypothetical protein